jgi:dethiobiotin synthetase
MNSTQPLFVSGISTEVGKTVVSAVLVKALQAGYWKPVQSGDLHHTDTQKVADLVADKTLPFYPEAYQLETPCSPDAAAACDGKEIDLRIASLVPKHQGTLVVEGAGGLLVPLNRDSLIIDLIAEIGAPTILVSRHYLGSINHTLLSCEALQKRGISVVGILFNGKENRETEQSIQRFTTVPVIGRIDHEEQLNASVVDRWAKQFRKSPLLAPFTR